MRLKMILLFALFLFSVKIYSQDTKSPELYWVVETNIHYRTYSIVRFYNTENIKVHEVKIMGVYLDVRVPKQKRILDQLAKEYLERASSSAEKTQSKHTIHLNAKTLSLVKMRQF